MKYKVLDFSKYRKAQNELSIIQQLQTVFSNNDINGITLVTPNSVPFHLASLDEKTQEKLCEAVDQTLESRCVDLKGEMKL